MANRINDLIKTTRERCLADLHGVVVPPSAEAVPVAVAALLLNCPIPRIYSLIKTRQLSQPTAGMVSAASLGGYVKSLEADGYDHARTAFVRERARISELKRRQMESGLVAATAVEASWASVVEVVRQRILAIPAEVAPALAESKDPAKVATIMAAAIDCALNELSNTPVVVDPN